MNPKRKLTAEAVKLAALITEARHLSERGLTAELIEEGRALFGGDGLTADAVEAFGAKN